MSAPSQTPELPSSVAGHSFAPAFCSAIYVRCPEKKCGHVFDSDETFWWGADWNGDPTVEHIYCPKCHASTKPYDRRRRQWSYDSFVVVESPNAEVSHRAPN